MTAGQLLERATVLHREGRLAEARSLYDEILAIEPAHALAQFRSGLLDLQDGNADRACQRIGAAVAAAPGDARFRIGLGAAAAALQRWPEATLAYEAALALQPDDADTWNLLGNCHRRGGAAAAAEAAYREAYALQPEVAAHAINLGIVLCDRREFAAAEAVLRRAAALDPLQAEAAFNHAVALRGLGRLDAAADEYRRAIALRPDYVDAFVNLGNLYRDSADHAQAGAAYTRARQIDPRSIEALNNAACLERTLGQLQQSEALLREALAIDPGQAVLHDNLGNVLKDGGELDAAIAAYREALRLDPRRAATHSNLCYALSFQCDDPTPILAECRRWNQHFAAGLWDPATHYPNERSPGRRLRIGYVSADFRDHCQSLFMLPLLAHHDHAAFEIHCYSGVRRADDYTRRARAAADLWRDVDGLDDAALAAQIRDDRIDILVDLAMHMAGGRPLVFARKPAPLQLAWLAYPGTTGLATMDYRLSDANLDPPGADVGYAERTWRLPDSFWCYDPLAPEPCVSGLPAARNGYVTFGCLNNPCKFSAASLALWSAVLNAVPGSKLLLMAPPGRYRQRLCERFATQGIAAERLAFEAFRPRAQYLQSYQQIDIGLDTLPYNGHTTSLDSLWMGVPVVTRIGRTCAGRGTFSQLAQLGLTDLAAATDQDFVDIAAGLAADLPRLAGLRRDLRTRMQGSPLMDSARFARSIEAAYRGIWRDYCARAPQTSAAGR